MSEAQKAALDMEIAAKEQLRETLDEYKLQAKREKAAQLTQVCNARALPCYVCSIIISSSQSKAERTGAPLRHL